MVKWCIENQIECVLIVGLKAAPTKGHQLIRLESLESININHNRYG